MKRGLPRSPTDGARKRLKEGLHAYLRRQGWQLSRYPVSYNAAHKRSLLLDNLGTRLVVDIGANTGQFATELRTYGYRGRILSFEPLPDAYVELSRNAQRDPGWDTVASALGSTDGVIAINVAGNSVSSSPLAMLDRHSDAAPGSAVVGQVRRPIARLDSALADRRLDHLQHLAPYLKIDTQGFEREVLAGAPDTLKKVSAVELELSLTELYEDQPLYDEIVALLDAAGFRLAGVQPGFWDCQTGETLQVDGLFLRND
ncbi:FkbM family methyltransferase [Sporichthya sp.]|uniref:FkbM family methyltransferase n=1 Tax=Sporichthya sp. TaxID=65475 RepID=UPI0025DB5339|nr:FkbM family methyltransferase [Sporichthya sp.]